MTPSIRWYVPALEVTLSKPAARAAPLSTSANACASRGVAYVWVGSRAARWRCPAQAFSVGRAGRRLGVSVGLGPASLALAASATCGFRALSPSGILLGLLAKIKCSICSYQFNIWYPDHWSGDINLIFGTRDFHRFIDGTHDLASS